MKGLRGMKGMLTQCNKGDAVTSSGKQQLEPAKPESAKPESFLDSMKFSGFAPEIINGRVAQVAFMAGLGAEISTGESFPQQFHDHPFALAFAAGLITMASFMPSIQGSTDYTSNPNSVPGQDEATFNPDAEKLNGRVAMLGLMGILAVESLKGGALF